MRKIVLDTNCLLMSLPRISPYRKIWDDFLKGKLTLCVTNEIIEEYLEIIEQKTNANIASNVVSVILSQKNVEFITPYYKLHGLCNEYFELSDDVITSIGNNQYGKSIM